MFAAPVGLIWLAALILGDRPRLAGVGAALCGAALRGASLNVFINTAAMKDRSRAAALNGEAEALLAEYGALADRIFLEVKTALGG